MLSSSKALFGAAIAALALAACNATSSSLPRAGLASSARAFAPTGTAALAFRAIGPSHMTSGGIPNSGKVNAFAVDPANPKVIYMAGGRGTGLESYSSAGIYRTLDGGKTWLPIDRGLREASGRIASTVNALWLDPLHPRVLLAATQYAGIFRSTNGGSSWTNVNGSSGATQFYADGTTLYASSAAGILASSDDGASWQVVLPVAVSAIGGTGATIYAGGLDGSIYAGAGSSWSKVGALPFTPNTGTDGSVPAVHQIAVDPTTPTTVYATSNDGTWDQALFGSTDGGHTWAPILQSVYSGIGLGTQAIAYSRVHPHRLYIGADGAFYYIDAQGQPNPQPQQAAATSIIDIRNVWTVANGGDDRCWIASDQGLDDVPACSATGNVPNDDVVSASAATGLARHIAIAPNARTLIVSLQDFDSHVTFDGGAHWSERYLYEDGFVALRPGDPQICYAYDEAVGLSISTDGCHSFPNPTGVDATLIPSRLMTTPIAFDPRHPLHMYVLSGPIEAPGPNGPHGAFASTDGGATFTRLAWPFANPGTIVVDPRNGNHIVVGDLSGHGSNLAVTFDGGRHWQRARGVPSTQFWYAVAIDPARPATVLATSVDAGGNVFVLRSLDGGKTFVRGATVVNAPFVAGRLGERHPRRPGLRRAPAMHQPFGPPPAFVYSPARAICFDPSATRADAPVVLTTQRGAYLSRNDGTSWQRIDATTIAHSFWGIAWNAGYLYLASDGQGVLRSTARVGP